MNQTKSCNSTYLAHSTERKSCKILHGLIRHQSVIPYLTNQARNLKLTTDEKYTIRGHRLRQRPLSYSELGKLDSDLAAAAGNTAWGAIAGIILTIAQCHNECNNENQEANHCCCEFDPRKHLFFPVRTIQNDQ